MPHGLTLSGMTVDAITQGEASDYSKLVAEEVRALAARKRVSGADLAKALGISAMSMSRRMNGHLPFGVDELAVVANALGVPVEQLLPHLDSNQKPADYPVDVEGLAFPFPRPRGTTTVDLRALGVCA